MAWKRIAATLCALVCAFSCLAACGAPTEAARPSPAPPADTAEPTPGATPAHAIALCVVQTIYNSLTGRQTESVFNEEVSVGESYTIKNANGTWSLTFTLLSAQDGVATVETERRLAPPGEGDAGDRAAVTFDIPYRTPYRVDELLKNIEVWYTFTFTDPFAAEDPPVRFENRHILSNIRRTLHESGKSAFTQTELALIPFVKLKGRSVTDIGELRYLPNLETLSLRRTLVTDLSPLAESGKLRWLALIENDALDYQSLPPLPSLTELIVSGETLTREDVEYLETLLPDCSIVADLEK